MIGEIINYPTTKDRKRALKEEETRKEMRNFNAD